MPPPPPEGSYGGCSEHKGEMKEVERKALLPFTSQCLCPIDDRCSGAPLQYSRLENPRRSLEGCSPWGR